MVLRGMASEDHGQVPPRVTGKNVQVRRRRSLWGADIPSQGMSSRLAVHEYTFRTDIINPG